MKKIFFIKGFRLGPYLHTFLPLFLDYCEKSLSNEEEEEDDRREQLNEVRENCLYAIESFVIRCPAEVDSKIEDIVRLMLQFCKYDPNYNDEGGDDEDEEGFDDEEDYLR